jgi:WD40 repeat protein
MSPADADLLLDYLGGRLTDRETVRVQARLRLEPSLADALVRLARDEAAMSEWVVGQLAPPPVLPRAAPARWPLVGWASVAAAVLVGGLSIFLASRKPPVYIDERTTALTPAAKVVAVRGEANLITSDGPVPVTVGQEIRPGDRLSTGANGEAVVTLPDDGRVELRSDTEVRILPPETDARVDVVNGSVRTEVTRADPMTVSTPHALIRAAAALTSVALDGTGTTVTAEADRTQMTRTLDNQSRNLSNGETISTGTGTTPMVPVKPRDAQKFTAGSVTQAAVSSAGFLAVCTSDARVVLCRLEAMDTPIVSRKFPGNRIGGLAFSADGEWVVATADDHRAYIRDGHTGTARSKTDRQHTEIRAVALSPDGSRLAVGGRMWRGTAAVKVFDGRTGAELKALGAGGSVNAVAFSPDGKTLAAVGTDSTVRRWDVDTWQLKGDPLQLPGEALALAYSADGRTLAVGGRDGFLKLFGPDDKVVAVDGPAITVAALAFSPGGNRLAVAVGDSVWVWDLSGPGPQVLRTITAHRDRVNSVAYTADGKSLVSAGGDGSVKVWDVE